ncbi:acylphosphatase [Desulforhopalus singaporensis]|uniref:Acylphosphatase n=1 Tax=Desulforhopalus singaporensis TaxID=91360 RepID=A0A1H0U6K6_9BACT|nr:acylphosphatase [Desulforhopalus singaporensis]SDP61922.1 acylphosphatase [Desulforhopalus singaporensis]
METIRVIVTGRVQGVFFRDYTQKQAARLGLCGWVRNLPDGTVEALIQGKATDIRKMLNWLNTGSPLATVTGIKTWKTAESAVFSSFQIRY